MRSDFLTAADARDTVASLDSSYLARAHTFYRGLILAVASGLTSAGFIRVDETVDARGMVQPVVERAELRAAVSGVVAEVFVEDNQEVRADQPVIVLEAKQIDERLARNRVAQQERGRLLRDLELALSTFGPLAEADPVGHPLPLVLPAFETPEMLSECLEAASRHQGLCQTIRAQAAEVARHTPLAARGLVPAKTISELQETLAHSRLNGRVMVLQLQSAWQARKAREEAALLELRSGEQELLVERARHTLRAPADGVFVRGRAAQVGRFVAAGELLAELSPDAPLVAEIRVSTSQIGRIKAGQRVRLQVDAFPYVDWGMLDGTVREISADVYARQGAAPTFKLIVNISPPPPTTTAPQIELRKGLAVTAKFIVGRRQLYSFLQSRLVGAT